MTSTLLNCRSFVPPLLESQLSPPSWIVNQHLQYLQKWREYLCWCYCDGQYDLRSSLEIQGTIDEFIQTILLLEIIRQYDEYGIPSFAEIINGISCMSSLEISSEIQKTLSLKLLKKIFEPDLRLPTLQFWFKNHVKPLTDIPESARTFYDGKIPVTILTDFHQLCLDIPIANPIKSPKSSRRRNEGIYYTPTPIVDYLTYQIMERAFIGKNIKQISKTKVLDPSCGYGSFLIASYRYVLEKLGEHCKNHAEACFAEKAMSLLQSMIYGTDIDENAIRWTRRLLFFTVWQASLIHDTGQHSSTDISIPDLSNNVLCHDFLEIGQKTFSSGSEIFDIIIGGPPFVRIHELFNQHPERIEDYKQNFKVASGQFDLYMLFIEKAIDLMEHNSLLGMSVSNSFMRSVSGRKLRELISDTCCIEEIVEFEDNRVYPNASVRIALITLRKTQLRTQTKYIFVKGREGLRRRLKNMNRYEDTVSVRKVDIHPDNHGTWTLDRSSDLTLINKIEHAGTQIKDLPIDVHFGIATGAGNIFMLRNTEDFTKETVIAKSRFTNDFLEFERAVLRPVLRGRHLEGYAEPDPQTMCICPYDKNGTILPEPVLREEYPRAYQYLQSYREVLESRNTKRYLPWYSFRTDRILRYLQSPKLISSTVSSGASFTLEQQNFLCSSSVLIVRLQTKEIDPHLLLAIFNSSVFRKWACHNMPSLGDGWISFRIGKIREFPIPIKSCNNKGIIREVIDMVHTLMSKYSGFEDEDRVRTEIDKRICLLYSIPELNISSW